MLVQHRASRDVTREATTHKVPKRLLRVVGCQVAELSIHPVSCSLDPVHVERVQRALGQIATDAMIDELAFDLRRSPPAIREDLPLVLRERSVVDPTTLFEICNDLIDQLRLEPALAQLLAELAGRVITARQKSHHTGFGIHTSLHRSTIEHMSSTTHVDAARDPHNARRVSTLIERPEIEQRVRERFDAGANPLLLCGPVGCGKSALAKHLVGDMADECVVVDCEDVDDPVTLRARIADAFGAAEGLDAEAVDRLIRARGDVVVVLDDFDRATACDTEVEGWRDAAPRARWIVTARRRVAVADVELVEIPPMTLGEAVALFEARARTVRPQFCIDEQTKPLIERLVSELDRIPFAIELAAARAHTLGPAAIVERLPQRFQILRDGESTLHAAISLSWDLLNDAERTALAQCTAFRGGFSLDAVEKIVQLDPTEPWVVDVVQSLVEQSLLRASEHPALAGEQRFDMLASIREFVVGHAPELAISAHDRHAQYFRDRAQAWTRAMRRKGGERARARVEVDQQNLIAAASRATGDAEAVELALLLDRSFRLRGTREIWERTLREAAERSTGRDPFLRARVARALGELHILVGAFESAADELAEAARLAESANERVALGWIMCLSADVARRSGAPSDAVAFALKAVQIAREVGQPNLERVALSHGAGASVDLGEHAAARQQIAALEEIAVGEDLRDEAALKKRLAYVCYYLGNQEEHRRLTQAALQDARASGDRRLEALCVQGLGDAAFARNDYEDARAWYLEALPQHRALGTLELEGALLGNLGAVHHRLNELDAARDCYRDALAIHRQTGARPYAMVVWFALGILELECGHREDADAALARSAELATQIQAVSDEAAVLMVRAWLHDDPDLMAAAAMRFAEAGDEGWAALCRGETDSLEGTPALIARLRTEPGVDPEAVSRSLHARAARACWQPSAEPAARREVDLVIDEGALWFEHAGVRIDLRRRKAPRRILAHLIDLRARAPRDAVDVYEAFEIGWPDEVATAEAAADRVYWAIRTLRKLGLEHVLLTSDEGYLLDPDAVIDVI